MTVFSFLPPSHWRWELAAPKLSAAWLDNMDIFIYFSRIRTSAQKGYYRTLNRHGSLAFIVFFLLHQDDHRRMAMGIMGMAWTLLRECCINAL
ncbi:hypothetical protein CGRA01v4_06633 [Colletotrichum graminicola]|uniref:Uncharacterized protein n=1 Tax=Colletotrichum graminicola (strain M1.001 / M2 / FGSC 10212) TaxID=645133 RepID=E3Q376_COLGM|nr:uncharacterized protein GLRG_00199 [Colletotrichum graminicola M1.001]EFQ25055.1 hypothetical protein GLRG_00199 [Colletotrichum graminicola M1.001]WDK15352.1 hypothetical protein CGRA01v4_06633 [Colletotrichum graminicola]